MPVDFYSFVDNAIDKALPATCKRISPDKLLGRDSYKIRHAFHTAGTGEPSKLINILVFPMSLPLDDYLERQILQLRDYILSRNCVLVLISECDQAGKLGDAGVFIEDKLLVDGPQFLWLQCGKDKQYQTTLNYTQFESLDSMIRKLCLGEIGYIGPVAGLQQVNLELMADQCWKCHRDMTTVTGIVFPNRQLNRWDIAGWQYYHTLFPLSELEGEAAGVIAAFVEKMRVADKSITPVGRRYSKTMEKASFAASCPFCHALRGGFYVEDDRMQYLHSLHSRKDGSLQYFSIPLQVDQQMIATLSSGAECCDHACGMGWRYL